MSVSILGACDRQEAAWPSHPLKIEVGYPTDGDAHVLAHVLAHHIGRTLHAKVVVIGRHPASGAVATTSVARAPVDGYTLLVAGTATMVTASLLNSDISYLPQREWCPVALVAETPHVLLVSSESPIETLEELVIAVHREPEAFNYASLGRVSTEHALGALFANAMRLKITELSYRNSATAVVDLLGGNVSMMFASVQATLPAIRAGKVRALAVSSVQRIPQLPGTPTLAERGFADLTFTSWYGLFASCDLDRNVEGQLIAAAQKAIAQSDMAGVLRMDASAESVVVG